MSIPVPHARHGGHRGIVAAPRRAHVESSPGDAVPPRRHIPYHSFTHARCTKRYLTLCRYAPYEGAEDTGVRVELFGHATVGYFHQQIKGVDFVFVDHPSYPRPGGLYSDEHGVYGDNQVRYGTGGGWRLGRCPGRR